MKKSLVIFVIIAWFVLGFSLEQTYADEGDYKYIEDSAPRVIVEGIGRLTAKPDEAEVRLGIVNEETYLKKAFEKQTKSMNEVISAIKDLGIKEDDIKTTHYSVIPRYKDNKSIGGWGRQKPSSFEVSHQLTVKIRDLQKVGDIIDTVIEQGAIFIYDLEFNSSKIEELEKEVRLKAAKNAREKAQILAEGTGFKLGRVLKVDEAKIEPPYLRRAQGRAFEEARFDKLTATTQIGPGSIELEASCTVIYEITE